MEFVWVSVAAAVAALLTLFTGFGLGTLLLPAFAIFFPLPIAVAATAVVHLANNLFKAGLLGRFARRDIVLRFGLPAVALSFVGALLLARLAHLPAVAYWSWAGRTYAVTPTGLVLGALIGVFALLELTPALERLQFSKRWLALGGALSGFCGGISGHQGALRAAFLARAGLDRDAFLGTSVVCAVMVDAARLIVYGASFTTGHFATIATRGGGGLVLVATLAAFVGSFVGARLVRKTTMRVLQRCVGVGLVLLAVAIGAGLI